MTIANRLDEAMHDAGKLSQSELARRSKVPQPTINRILKGNGKKGPETATLLALAKALNVEFNWLQQGVGPKALGAAPDGMASQVAPVVAAPEAPPRWLRHWLNDDEAEILNQYRSMTEDSRKLTRLFIKRQKRDDVGRIVDES